MARLVRPRNVVDETTSVRCGKAKGVIREEVWQSEGGEVARYNLAFICLQLCRVDNGRVLGYDNHHDHHHWHFMGATEPILYTGYDELLGRFLAEADVFRNGTQ
jgi:hypothetical protein